MMPLSRILTIVFLFILNIRVNAQGVINLNETDLPGDIENVFVKNLFSDTLMSSFLIVIKKDVAAHKHLQHSEHVYVLSGEGELLLGEQKFHIKAGDLVFIPKNTVHQLQVLSTEPMKVISLQAPFFDGTDRVIVQPEQQKKSSY
jgi:mannose-6-phosphate isomerase-like protein (cupin superfamily)